MSVIAGRVISSVAVTGLVGTGLALSAAPAQAADLGQFNIDCADGTAASPQASQITGLVGDTFTIWADDDGGASGDCTLTLPSNVSGPTSITNGTTGTFTLIAAGSGIVTYGISSGGTGTFTANATTASNSSGGGPIMALQQLPIPASGNCADADPNDALWARGNTTEWTLQWGNRSEPVEFHGFVCGRLVWANGTR